VPLSINSFHSFMIFFSLLSCAFDQFFCFVFNLCFDEIVTGTQGMIEINDVVLIKFQRISFWFFTFVHVWYTSYLPQDWAIFLSALPLLYFTSAFCVCRLCFILRLCDLLDFGFFKFNHNVGRNKWYEIVYHITDLYQNPS